MSDNTASVDAKWLESVEQFLEGLLNPERYGWAVSGEVRNDARELLGIPRVKNADNPQ